MGLQRNDFDKLPVFEECERLGEAAVRADLERAGKIFQSGSQKAAAWEWLHERANAAQETRPQPRRQLRALGHVGSSWLTRICRRHPGCSLVASVILYVAYCGLRGENSAELAK